ncbi:MAG: hypothetical protein WAS21_25735 [Geminicoccaceae bacterium]
MTAGPAALDRSPPHQRDLHPPVILVPGHCQAWRLIGHSTVARIARPAGGGFSDQTRHPHTWASFVQIDGLNTRVTSARGLGQEWTSLDRLERWLRGQGFRYWWVANKLDSLGR